MHSSLPFDIVRTPKNPLLSHHTEVLCTSIYALWQRKKSWVILECISKRSHKQNLYIDGHLQECQLCHNSHLFSGKYGFLFKKKSFHKKKIYWLNIAALRKRGRKVFWKLSQTQKAYLVLLCFIWFIYTNKYMLNIYYMNI